MTLFTHGNDRQMTILVQMKLNLVIICRQPEGEDHDEEDEDDDFNEIMHRC